MLVLSAASASRLWLWWQAWRDARQRVPHLDAAAPTQAEMLVVDGARAALRRAAARVGAPRQLARLRLDAARAALQDAEAAFAREAGSPSPRLVSDRTIGPALHWGVLLVLTAADVWYNATAFEGLGDVVVAAWGLAAVLGIGLPMLGHAFGVQLRQEEWPWRRVAGWAALLAVAAAAMIAAAGVRAATAHAEPSAAPTAGMVLPSEDARPQAPMLATVSAAPLGDDTLRAVFVVMSAFMFAVAVAVGAFGCDSRRGYPRATRVLREARRAHAAAAVEMARLDAALTAAEAAAIDGARARLRYYRLVHRRWRSASPHYFDDPAHPAHDLAASIAGTVAPPSVGEVDGTPVDGTDVDGTDVDGTDARRLSVA